MTKPDTLIVDGRAYSWRQLCKLRQRQLAAWEAGQPIQLALFEVKIDHRPAADRSADRRYAEPSLFGGG